MSDKKATFNLTDVHPIGGGAISARDFDDESEEPGRVLAVAIAKIHWTVDDGQTVREAEEWALVCLGPFGALVPLTERAPWQREPKAPADAS